MKKILFLLLSTCAMYGQIVPTGQEQDFDYGIKNTASQLDDNAVFITVQNSDGVQGKSTSSVWAKKIYVDNADVKKAFLSTGLIKNGLVQANADPTKFNITAGIGIISNFDDPENPTSTIVNFPAFTGITPTYLTTSNITYIAINSNATIVQQATPFTNIQRRDLIILGAVIHSNLTTINLVNNISAPTNADTNQLHDLMEAIGALNVDGNKIVANNANLSINKTAGDIFKLGVNFANDWKNPHKLNLPLQTLATFRYRTQNGTEGSNVTALNPALYDVANVLTSVPSNKFSIQTVTLFQTGAIRVQYGQATYATLSEAESAINTRTYNVEPNIAANGITRAYIILKNTATSLQNASDTKIVEAGKFGNVGGSGGAITLDAIVAALGFTPENVANKQNSLAVDGTGTKYPTVDAINSVYKNLKSYGALGNAVYNTTGDPSALFSGTFDTAAFANALSTFSDANYSKSGGVMLNTPLGNYRLLANINGYGVSTSNSFITGNGYGNTVLHFERDSDGSEKAIVFSKPNGNADERLIRGGGLKNLTLKTNNANTIRYGLGLDYVEFMDFENVAIEGFYDSAVFGGIWESHFSNITFRGCGAGLADGLVGTIPDWGVLDFDSHTALPHRDASNNTTFTDLNFSSCYGTLIRCVAYANTNVNINFFGLKGESPNFDAGAVEELPTFYFDRSANINVNGGFYTQNGTGATRNGVMLKIGNDIANGLISFSNFSFNQNNGASFSQISHQRLKALIELSGQNSQLSLLNCTLNDPSNSVGMTSGGYLIDGVGGFLNIKNLIINIKTGTRNLSNIINPSISVEGDLTIRYFDSSGWTGVSETFTYKRTPTTSASTYDFVTRNTTTGVFEKVLSNTIATTASPTFTGTPTAPTATVGTNTTQIATTAFVQTATRPYKVYTALLSQTGTNAPTATILENTLGGTVVWSRTSAGIYLATLSGVFTTNKTFILMNTGHSVNGFEGAYWVDSSNIQVVTYTSVPAYTDGRLSNNGASIEIRVYN